MSTNAHLVVTVHGIRTYGQWQSRLKRLLEAAEPGITVLNEKYGYFSILAFLFPVTRWIVTRRFRRSLLAAAQSRPWTRIDLVGHSFGTHLIGWTLRGIPPAHRPQIHTIILAGSVLKSNFGWGELLGTSVRRVVNECGTSDAILILNQACVLFTGMAGRIGFFGLTGNTFQNRFYQCGHSGYFEQSGKPYDDFMRSRWIPLLTSEGPIEEIDDRVYLKGVKGTLAGLLLWALNNAEPIKLSVYLTPLIILCIVMFTLYRNAERERRVALARQLASDSAFSWNATADPRTALLLGVESVRNAETVNGYQALWNATGGTGREVSRLRHQGAIRVVAFSPVAALVATGAADRTARVFEARTGREVSRLEHEGSVRMVAFSPDGAVVLTGSEDRSVRVFEAQTGREISRLKHDGPVLREAFSADGRLVAMVTAGDGTLVFDTHTGSRVSRLEWGLGDVVAFSPDNTFIVTGERDGSVHMFDTKTGREIYKRSLHRDFVRAVVFSPDGQLVATASEDGSVRVFEAQTGQELSQIAHQAAVYAVAFSPDGHLVASGGVDATVRVSEARTGREVSRSSHGTTVLVVAFSPDGMLVATGSMDTSARVFHALTGREVFRLAHGEAVPALAFSSDSALLATGSWDGTARVFETWAKREVFRISKTGLSGPTLSLEADYLAIGHEDQSAEVFDMRTGQRILHLNDGAQLSTLAVSPDGARLAIGYEDGQARLVDVRTMDGLPLSGQENVRALAFSRNGALLATGSKDGIARILEVLTQREIFRVTKEGAVQAIAFSPNGALVAIGTDEAIVRVFEVSTGRLISSLENVATVYRMAFSPDAKLIATASDDKTARIFDTPTGRQVGRLTHQGEVYSVTFSSDGRLLATGSEDRTARVLELASASEVARMQFGGPVGWTSFLPGGRLLRIVSVEEALRVSDNPISVSDLINEACSKLDRNLTSDEWLTYLGQGPRRDTCDQLNSVATVARYNK